MTMKEYAEKHYPELVDSCCVGGMVGCPHGVNSDWFNGCKTENPTEDECTACWNRDIPVSEPISTKTKRAEILDKAKFCVCGQREHDYGKPENNFGVIADLWSAYTGTEFTAKDVTMMMALLKIARIASGTATEDSFVDLAGYAACGGEIVANGCN